MIYVVQILAILFAIAQARHNAPSVTHFAHWGVDNTTMARFHRNNSYAKAVVCLLAAAVLYPGAILIVIAFILSGLWIYLLFDPVLNKNTGRNWDYLGQNDADGRRWIRWFGSEAGEKKAIILSILIIAINILILLL